MVLESLSDLVETLRARITAHARPLTKSEALTRYALIDPLLRELGWNTEDPALVIPEHQTGGGSADYALLNNGSPVMMVEAKKLGTPFGDSVLSQGVNYCLMQGTNYFSVTDGQRWEVYETLKPGRIDEKRVVDFDLKDSSPAEVCLKALALWRPSVQSGYGVPGTPPLVGDIGTGGNVQTPDPSVRPTPAVVGKVDGDANSWVPITDLEIDGGQPAPVEMMFPDGSSVPIRYWGHVMVEPVRWLIDNRSLTHDSLPIQRAGRYLVATTAIHPGGAPMTRRSEASGAYVEKNYSGKDCVKNAKIIAEHGGQDPTRFKVRFSRSG